MKQHLIIETTLKQNAKDRFTTVDELDSILNRYSDAENISLGYRYPINILSNWQTLLNRALEVSVNNRNLKKIFVYFFSTKIPLKDIDLFFDTYKTYSDKIHLIIDITDGLSDNTVDFTKKNYRLEKPFDICLRIKNNRPDINKIKELIQKIGQKISVNPEIYFDNMASEGFSLNIAKPFDIGTRIAFQKNYNRLFSKLKKDFDIKDNNPEFEDCSHFFKRKPCKKLFFSPYFFKNKATICCLDDDLKHSYDLSCSDIVERKNKYLHIMGYFDRIEKCSICPGYEAITETELFSFLKEEDNESLIENYKNRIKTGFFFHIYKPDNIEGLLTFPENKIPEETGIPNSLKKHREDDFCCGWTRILKKENGRLFSGCREAKIPVEDYDDFCKSLSGLDYSNIPDKCFYCREKFSLDPVHDREYHYRFSENDIHKSDIKTKDNLIFNIALSRMENHDLNGDHSILLKKLNRYLKWRYFLFAKPSKRLKDEAVKIDSPFILLNIALNDQAYLENLIDLHKKYKWTRIPFPSLAIECFIRFIDKEIFIHFKDIFKYIMKTEDVKDTLIFRLSSRRDFKEKIFGIRDSSHIDEEWKRLFFSDEGIIKALIKYFIKNHDKDIYISFFSKNNDPLKNNLLDYFITEDIKTNSGNVNFYKNLLTADMFEKIKKKAGLQGIFL